MIAITIDDEDDAEFQADLARAIAASLEPDLPGPHDEVPRADNNGWNALLAVGQAARLGSNALNAGCRSPALPTADDDDDDFQRQMAAAMAASIQSAEEDRRRREIGGIPPPHRSLPMQGPTYAPQHGHAPLALWRMPPQQQQPQGFLANNGSFCCSSGLVLKPLTASWGSNTVAQTPISASPCPAMSPATWTSSFRDATASALSPAAAAAGVADGEVTVGDDAALANGCVAYPVQPVCSPDSSEGDSENPGGIASKEVVATRGTDLVEMLQAKPAPCGAARAGSAPVQLSSSPGKHGRTPSLTAATDLGQPQMKRSRPGSESGAARQSIPGEVVACEGLRCGAAWQQRLQDQHREVGAVTGMTRGGSTGGVGCFATSDEVVQVASVQLHSPPERPASAASGCTASMGCAAYVSDDGGGGYAGEEPQVLAVSIDDPWRVVGRIGPRPLMHPPSQQQQQDGCDGRGAALSGVSLVGGSCSGSRREPLSKVDPFPSDLSPGSRSASAAGAQQMQLSSPGGPPEAVIAAREGRSGMSDVSNQQQQILTALGYQSGSSSSNSSSEGGCAQPDFASLDLCHQGKGRVQAAQGQGAEPAASAPGALPLSLRGPWATASALPLAEGAPRGFVPQPVTEGDLGPMIMDAGATAAHHVDVVTAAADVPRVPSGADPGEAGAPGWGSGFSGADRRMLLQQRVWWWLGPGRVQSGRISSIDRRSEPLLYSVRLDSTGPEGTEAPTIIATADCLFPYMAHGDRVMCRLPPSTCGKTPFCSSGTNSSSGSSSAVFRSLEGAAAAAQQRRQQLEVWPGFHSVIGLGPGDVDLAGDGGGGGGDAAAASGPCAWMLGTLQHCIFDGREPMVHVLLGPEQLPYSVAYEFVVPVSDAAEGSGCSSAAQPASAAGLAEPVGAGGFGSAIYGNTCTEIVPSGRVV
ncbi:hypothetical protein VaNZ11_004910 [Volvox africanus]|uniref:Uncharacterized protein n=1 Tax=Volvox africanus TaxID=51714 RepID=A0ABQ5RYF3_9CHLO|nr:hypothetical protein VaNZ11_004910 [Volvox africanus]